MDIVVIGRNVEVPDHYRVLVAEKLSRVERYDTKAIRYDIELFHEPNRRQSKNCQRVEITGITRGPVVRAEACGPDFYAALDLAVGKLEGRLRRAADRRKVHHGRRQPTSVAAATAPLAAWLTDGTRVDGSGVDGAGLDGARTDGAGLDGAGDGVPAQRWLDDAPDDSGPGRVVREKEHSSDPMTVDQALYEMELVGHDFYLFLDAGCSRPSVVYRRKGFDYGVIRLV